MSAMLVVHVANIMVMLDANMLPMTNAVHKWFIEMIIPVVRMVGIIACVRNGVNSSVRHRQSRHGGRVSGAHGSDTDFPGQTGEQKTRAHARDNENDRTGFWEAGSEATDPPGSVPASPKPPGDE
jgi:hypothetical protein